MGRPTNALIVDDEPHVRTFLRLLLRELGIAQTWEVSDGAQALEFVRQQRPELVLLDVNLPVMTGLEALARLREIDEEVPIFIVSSQMAKTTVVEALELGADAYVLKHAPKAEALAQLAEALDALEDEAEEA